MNTLDNRILKNADIDLSELNIDEINYKSYINLGGEDTKNLVLMFKKNPLFASAYDPKNILDEKYVFGCKALSIVNSLIENLNKPYKIENNSNIVYHTQLDNLLNSGNSVADPINKRQRKQHTIDSMVTSLLLCGCNSKFLPEGKDTTWYANRALEQERLSFYVLKGLNKNLGWMNNSLKNCSCGGNHRLLGIAYYNKFVKTHNLGKSFKIVEYIKNVDIADQIYDGNQIDDFLDNNVIFSEKEALYHIKLSEHHKFYHDLDKNDNFNIYLMARDPNSQKTYNWSKLEHVPKNNLHLEINKNFFDKMITYLSSSKLRFIEKNTWSQYSKFLNDIRELLETDAKIKEKLISGDIN